MPQRHKTERCRSLPTLLPGPLAAAVAALVMVLAGGCAGYQIGTPSLYRTDIRTVYVPVFQSAGFRRDLGERLTEAVVKQIESQTTYKVVSSPNADSILTGRILSDTKSVASVNRNDDPRNIKMKLRVETSWVDRRGNLLHGGQVPLPPMLLEVEQAEHLFPEAGQSVAVAQQDAIHGLARQIVQQMEAPW